MPDFARAFMAMLISRTFSAEEFGIGKASFCRRRAHAPAHENQQSDILYTNPAIKDQRVIELLPTWKLVSRIE